MTKIIAFTGAAGSGKSTAARVLVEDFGYNLVKFAGPLKDMLRAIGLNESEIEGHLKGEPCDLLGGQTPRHAMQTLGTEWGRQMICDTLWIDIWESRVLEHDFVVVDDMRFSNEAARVRAFGGRIIRVDRRDLSMFKGTNRQHASEAQLSGVPADQTISNNGSLADFINDVTYLAI